MDAQSLSTIIRKVYDAEQNALKVGGKINVSATTNPPNFTGVVSGVYTISAANTPEQLPDVSIPAGAIVVISADANNSGTIYIGNDTAQEFPLEPGDAIELNIDNTNKVYVRGNAGDKVRFIAEQ